MTRTIDICTVGKVLFGTIIKRITDLFNQLITFLSNQLIFRPEKINNSHYQKLSKHQNVILETVRTTDGEILDACLYNDLCKPSYDDLIFLYSHGNSGWWGLVVETNTVKYLSKYGSVFIYDYRGYGKSTGVSTDWGLFVDSISVWNFLTHTKMVPAEKIVLFGHSMGTSITANLLHYLLENNIECNRTIVLQNSFTSIQKLCNSYVPFIGLFVRSDFKTDHIISNIEKISNSSKIYFIHSVEDRVIDYQHSVDLHKMIKNNHSKLLQISGSHDHPNYDTNKDVDLHMSSINCIPRN
jgi:alpha/beta superfamily hydrolase